MVESPLVTRMLDGGLRPEEAAQASGVSVRAAYKWLQRFRSEGLAGLNDRSSRPKTCSHALLAAVLAEVIEQRRSRQTYRQISEHCRVAQSTIGRWLQRAGLNRLASLEPAAPSCATGTPHPATCSISISNSSGTFSVPDIGLLPTAHRTQEGWAGNSSMSPSTTLLAWPSPTLRPTKVAEAHAWHYSRHCAITDSSALPSGVSLPITAPATNPDASHASANAWRYATCRPNLTRHEQTARPAIHPDRIARMGLCPNL